MADKTVNGHVVKGLSQARLQQMKNTMKQIKHLLAKENGLPEPSDEDAEHLLIGDVILSQEDLDVWLAELKGKEDGNREKRQFINSKSSNSSFYIVLISFRIY